MLSHSVIPHHHHTHSIALHEKDNCNESESNEDEHKKPFHCHAFNDTNWYSQEDNNYVSPLQEYVFLLAMSNLLKETSVDRNTNYLPPEQFYHKQLYFSNLITRPPPFLS